MRPIDVACPHCEAPSGKPCTTPPDKHSLAFHHAERVDAAFAEHVQVQKTFADARAALPAEVAGIPRDLFVGVLAHIAGQPQLAAESLVRFCHEVVGRATPETAPAPGANEIQDAFQTIARGAEKWRAQNPPATNPLPPPRMACGCLTGAYPDTDHALHDDEELPDGEICPRGWSLK